LRVSIADLTIADLEEQVMGLEVCPEDREAFFDSLPRQISPSFCEEWYLAGPIIEREAILIAPPPKNSPESYRLWQAQIKADGEDFGYHSQSGRTPLEAAMRCYCALKLGNEVEAPDNTKGRGSK